MHFRAVRGTLLVYPGARNSGPVFQGAIRHMALAGSCAGQLMGGLRVLSLKSTALLLGWLDAVASSRNRNYGPGLWA